MLGENIKKIRQSKKMGLNKTASLAGISGSYLSNIEKGIKENPSMDVLNKIATALNVSINSFFEEEIKDHHINLQPKIFNNTNKTTIDYSALTIEEVSELEAIRAFQSLLDYIKFNSNNKNLLNIGHDLDEEKPLFNKTIKNLELDLLGILYNRGELINKNDILKGDDNNGNQEK